MDDSFENSVSRGVRAIPRFKFYNVKPPELFHCFNRQRDAFEFFDNLPGQDRSNVKLFQCELPVSGKRQFVVCSIDKYYSVFHTLGAVSASSRHHYEIIRDGFPCRGYFDLEYHKPSNPNIDGEQLTASWIACVASKIHSMFGISLESGNFAVLDSSTNDKFSKHVTVHIPAVTALGETSSTSISSARIGTGKNVHSTTEDPARAPKEALFANNGVLGVFVQALVSDMLTAAPANGNTAKFTQMNVTDPKSSYSHFWVKGKNSENLVCFADLGVYTRNRLFRLYGSCKHGKTKILTLSAADKAKFWPGKGTHEDILSPSKADRKLLAQRILERTFVVPSDLFLNAPLNCDEFLMNSPRDEKQTRVDGSSNTAPSVISAADGDESLNRAVYDIEVPVEFISSMSSPETIQDCGAHTSPEKRKRKHDFDASPRKYKDPVVAKDEADHKHPLTFNPTYQRLGVERCGDCLVGTVSSFIQNSVVEPSESISSYPNGDNHDGSSAAWCVDTPAVASLSAQVLALRNTPGLVFGSSSRTVGSCTNGGEVSAPGMVLGVTNSAAQREWAQRELLHSTRFREPSPFPELDTFVAAFVTHEGHDVAMRNSLDCNMDSVGHRRGAVAGYINSWKVYGAPSSYLPPCTGPAIRIRYQISGNRWCGNIGRQHKSNQIILECDLHPLRKHMTQSCWDPECRRYRSAPMDLPPHCLPEQSATKVRQLQDQVIDRCFMQIIEENEGL